MGLNFYEISIFNHNVSLNYIIYSAVFSSSLGFSAFDFAVFLKYTAIFMPCVPLC